MYSSAVLQLYLPGFWPLYQNSTVTIFEMKNLRPLKSPVNSVKVCLAAVTNFIYLNISLVRNQLKNIGEHYNTVLNFFLLQQALFATSDANSTRSQFDIFFLEGLWHRFLTKFVRVTFSERVQCRKENK